MRNTAGEAIQEEVKTARYGDGECNEYVDCISATVDSTIADLVRTVNRETKFATKYCCSGVLADHYDTDALQQGGIGIEQLDKQVQKSILPRQYIKLENPFLTVKEDTVLLEGEYFRLKNRLESVRIIDGRSDDEWSTPYALTYQLTFDSTRGDSLPNQEMGDLVLVAEGDRLYRDTDSLQEYDRVLQASLTVLEGIFENYQWFVAESRDESASDLSSDDEQAGVYYTLTADSAYWGTPESVRHPTI